MVAVATTTMAAIEDIATTTTSPTRVAADEVAADEVVADEVASDEVAASSGPSSGPVRLLMDMDADDSSDRQLQEDNASDVSGNVTQAPTSQTETSAAEECECPPPQVVSTFTATLSLSSADDLVALDFDDIKTELAGDQSWGDSVVVVPVVKIGIQYTLDVDITEAQCKAAVAVAYSMSSDIDISEDDVECGDASAAPSPASASAPAPAPAPAARRLRRLQTVKDVTISFTDVQAATAAATGSQDTTHFTTALADAGVDAVVAVREAVDVSVELTFTVTADAAIEEPTAISLESAVSTTTGGAIAVTAEITGFSFTFSRMPCSESDICDTGGLGKVANSETIGCDGETCTPEERDRCCAQIGSTGNAQGTCVLGSLFSVLLWHFV